MAGAIDPLSEGRRLPQLNADGKITGRLLAEIEEQIANAYGYIERAEARISEKKRTIERLQQDRLFMVSVLEQLEGTQSPVVAAAAEEEAVYETE